MNTKIWAYFVAFSLFLGVAFPVFAQSEENRYLVKSTSNFWKRSFSVRHTFEHGFTADLSDFQLRLARMFGAELEPVNKLYILPDVSQAEPSARKGPNAKRNVPSEQIPWGIQAVYNDSKLYKTSGGEGLKVAVLDTGVSVNHPDLKNRIGDCKDFSTNRPLIDGKCDDKNGHGTHVAGIIAADGGSDGLGVYGIAPQSDIFAYKVCGNSGMCWADDIAAAIRLASDGGVHIINLSLGSDSKSSLIESAVAYAESKGVLVVAASGNDGPYLGSIDYPAAHASVVAVGAFNSEITIPDWSSRGINSTTNSYEIEEGDIEFASPGVSIESAWKDGGYAILSGTSMAAPHIAGLAAKLWQNDSENPAESTRDLLRQFSGDLSPLGDDDSSGWGFPRL